MARTKKQTVAVAVFDSVEQAQRALDDLRQARFRESQLGLAIKRTEFEHLPEATELEATGAEEGALAGALAGAGVGAAWGIGIAAGLLPAIGPVIAGGTLAAILASAAAGAAATGLVGALIGMGIPSDEADYYESQFRAGRPVLTVKTKTRLDLAIDILRRHGGHAYKDRTEAKEQVPSALPDQPAEEGGKIDATSTEHRTIDVPVSRAEIVSPRSPSAVKGETPIPRSTWDESRAVAGEPESINKDIEVPDEPADTRRQNKGGPRDQD